MQETSLGQGADAEGARRENAIQVYLVVSINFGSFATVFLKSKAINTAYYEYQLHQI